MEAEVKRRLAHLRKRRSDLYKRINELEEKSYSDMQLLGQRKSSSMGMGARSQAQLNSAAEGFRKADEELADIGRELTGLKEQLSKMESAVSLYMAAEGLWESVKEITLRLKDAKTNLPAISLEEAMAAADISSKELIKLQEVEEQLINDEQTAKDTASLRAVKDANDVLKATQLEAEEALSRGNRSAYITAQRKLESLSRSAKIEPAHGRLKVRRGIPTPRAIHFRTSKGKVIEFLNTANHSEFIEKLRAIQMQIKEGQMWHSALYERISKIELVPTLEVELEELRAQATDKTEKAIAIDTSSDPEPLNLLEMSTEPLNMLKMPNRGGGRSRKAKPMRKRRRSRKKLNT
jgi:hypothetical protein